MRLSHRPREVLSFVRHLDVHVQAVGDGYLTIAIFGPKGLAGPADGAAGLAAGGVGALAAGAAAACDAGEVFPELHLPCLKAMSGTRARSTADALIFRRGLLSDSMFLSPS